MAGPGRTISTLVGPDGGKWVRTDETIPAGSYGRPFMTVFAESLLPLAKDRQAPGASMAVLVWCWANLSHETWRQVRQAGIADELGVSQASVGAALAALLRHGQLERRGAGPRQEWRLTPEASWRGTVGQYHRRRRADARGLKVIEGDAAPRDPRQADCEEAIAGAPPAE